MKYLDDIVVGAAQVSEACIEPVIEFDLCRGSGGDTADKQILPIRRPATANDLLQDLDVGGVEHPHPSVARRKDPNRIGETVAAHEVAAEFLAKAWFAPFIEDCLQCLDNIATRDRDGSVDPVARQRRQSAGDAAC